MLITHGESGHSGVGRTRKAVAPTSLAGQSYGRMSCGLAALAFEPKIR
jgi:hypothetical protein